MYSTLLRLGKAKSPAPQLLTELSQELKSKKFKLVPKAQQLILEQLAAIRSLEFCQEFLHFNPSLFSSQGFDRLLQIMDSCGFRTISPFKQMRLLGTMRESLSAKTFLPLNEQLLLQPDNQSTLVQYAWTLECLGFDSSRSTIERLAKVGQGAAMLQAEEARLLEELGVLHGFKAKQTMHVSRTQRSRLEMEVEASLMALQIKFKREQRVHCYTVDFLIEPNIVLEANGNHHYFFKGEDVPDSRSRMKGKVLRKKGFAFAEVKGEYWAGIKGPSLKGQFLKAKIQKAN